MFRVEAKAQKTSGEMTKFNTHPLEKILENRIAIIDGAMGTTIRSYGMTEADIRGNASGTRQKACLTMVTSSR